MGADGHPLRCVKLVPAEFVRPLQFKVRMVAEGRGRTGREEQRSEHEEARKTSSRHVCCFKIGPPLSASVRIFFCFFRECGLYLRAVGFLLCIFPLMDRKEAKRAKATRLAAVDVVSESGIPADRGSFGT